MPPVHHFMLADLCGSLLAACLYPLFVLLPGYSLAWWLDLCRFRRRTLAFRACLSLCLSIAVCPIAAYFAERFGTPIALWTLYAIAWAAFLFLIAREFLRHPLRLSRRHAAVAAFLVAWTAIAIFSLSDLQFGDRDYYSITALDFSVRTAFTHSLSAWGIPGPNPFYFPGHPEPMRYHYFWLILCALVERVSGGLVGPRQAWIGGVVWSGIGLMSLVALSFRILFYRGPDTFRRRTLLGIALLGVTGLDIFPAALGWILQARGLWGAVLPSIDWWNEQVDGFVSTALWEAHYLAGLVACFTVFLLLWEGARQASWSARTRHAVVAGVALASALGVSIYVTLVFGAFLAVWTLLAAARRWWPDAVTCAIAGVTSIVCAAPYLLSLRGPAAAAAAASGPPFQFQVRPLSAAIALLKSVGIAEWWQLALASLVLLPLNYFLELGFFFAIGRFWWNRRKRPLPPAELALALMLAVSLVICTFVRSSVISNNDLGWRGILVAQFVLVLWAVDVLTGACGPLAPSLRRMLAVLLVLGAVGTLYDIAILRSYPWLADHGRVSTMAWMSRDRLLGRRNYAQREAFEWITRNTPRNSKVQFNPDVSLQDTAFFLYGQRQIVAADEGCLVNFGGDPALCPPILATLHRLYPPLAQPAPASVAEACAALPVDLFIAKDSDPVWRDPASWVWRETPVFANAFVRLVPCPK